jgi:threonine dehydrogenase-like Zn-dependent dehydrogenase
MGLVHLIAGQAYGAGPILVVEPEPGRRAVAKELGADAVCAPEDAETVTKELTRGEGFPSVAMAVGFSAAVPTSIAITRKLGRINFFAGFPPGSKHDLDLNQVHYDEVKLFGTQNAPFHLYHRASQMVGRLGKIDRVITNRYSLAEAAEAYSARLGKEGLKSAVLMG